MKVPSGLLQGCVQFSLFSDNLVENMEDLLIGFAGNVQNVTGKICLVRPQVKFNWDKCMYGSFFGSTN